MTTAEELLNRSKDLLSASGLPEIVVSALAEALHFKVYWPEIEKLQTPKGVNPSKKFREVVEISTKHRVQANGRGTSLRAAIALAPDRTQWYYRQIYNILGQLGPSTDEQIYYQLTLAARHELKVSPSSARTRRSELVEAGWIKVADEGGLTEAGHPCAKWELIYPHG